MKNLTIRVNEKTLQAARARAAQHGTSVNAVLREALEDYAWSRERAREVMAKLVASAQRVRVATESRTWTRDGLHDR